MLPIRLASAEMSLDGSSDGGEYTVLLSYALLMYFSQYPRYVYIYWRRNLHIRLFFLYLEVSRIDWYIALLWFHGLDAITCLYIRLIYVTLYHCLLSLATVEALQKRVAS